MPYLHLILFALLSAGGQLALKAGVTQTPLSGSLSFTWAAAVLTDRWVAFGLSLWGVSTLLWLTVLSKIPLSTAYGITSLNYILVPLAATLVFKESLSMVQLVGCAVIASGIALVIYGHQVQ